MCTELTEEQLRLLEETDDPNKLRRLLDEIGGCGGCSSGRNSEPKDDDTPCCIHHRVRFSNRLLHIFKKMGF